MRLSLLVLLLAGCTEYDLIGEGGNSAFPMEEGPNLVVDDDVALARVYAHTTSEIFEVDPRSGEAESIGAFRNASGGLDGFVDMAIDLDGYLYAGTYDRLYRVDPNDGRVAPVCSLDFQPFAMTFGPNGVLYAGSSDNRLVEVDTVSCETTELVAGDWTTSGDIVGLPDGFIYWTVRGEGNDANDELVRVDPETGAASWVGVTGTSRLYGVGYSEGSLYGFSSAGEIVSIDPATAETEILDVIDTISWWGATTNPVRW